MLLLERSSSLEPSQETFICIGTFPSPAQNACPALHKVYENCQESGASHRSSSPKAQSMDQQDRRISRKSRYVEQPAIGFSGGLNRKEHVFTCHIINAIKKRANYSRLGFYKAVMNIRFHRFSTELDHSLQMFRRTWANAYIN